MQPTQHTLYVIWTPLYDKNNDAFEETDSERYGVCEKSLSMHCTVTGMNNRFLCSFLISSFFLPQFLCVTHTHTNISHRMRKMHEKKNQMRTRTENAKKNHFHIPLRTDKNICRLMIILPKFIGQHCAAAFTNLNVGEIVREKKRSKCDGTTVASSKLLLRVLCTQNILIKK